MRTSAGTLVAATGLWFAKATHGFAPLPELSVRHHPFVTLEHVNINIEDVGRAKEFWLEGLGFAADPRALAVHTRTVAAGNAGMRGLLWANIGLQQLHMPMESPAPQRVRGWLAFTFRNLGALEANLTARGIGFARRDDHLVIVEPMGLNRILAYENFLPDSFLGPASTIEATADRALPGGLAFGLGMREVGFDVPAGAPAKICRFYRHFFDSSAPVLRRGVSHCSVPIGYHQSLEFRETTGEVEEYDGHHVAVYVNGFLSSFHRFLASGLVWENPRFPQFKYRNESDVLQHHEFRFKDITDVDTGEIVFVLEHEIRSLLHPGFCCSSLLPRSRGALGEL